MRRLTRLVDGIATGVALALPLLVLPALGQPLTPDPGPEEPRSRAIAPIMREMRDMQADLDRMQDEMMQQGMSAMRERIARMRGRMVRMTEMMELHQRPMGAQCPGTTAKPNTGG